MPRPRTWHYGKPTCRGCLTRVVEATVLDREWMKDANCAGTLIDFFPHIDHKQDISLQRTICRSCQVQTECLTYAIRTREPHGIWGGMTPMERHIFAKRNRLPTFTPEGNQPE